MPKLQIAITVKMEDGLPNPYIEAAASGGYAFRMGISKDHTVAQLIACVKGIPSPDSRFSYVVNNVTFRGSELDPNDKRLCGQFIKDGDNLSGSANMSPKMGSFCVLL